MWSPNGRWLLLDWPSADQWLFVSGSHVRAVSNIEQEFPRPDRLGPMLQIAGGGAAARFGGVLQAGDRVPDTTVFLGPNEPMTIRELVEDGPKLLVFYLFDWSST